MLSLNARSALSLLSVAALAALPLGCAAPTPNDAGEQPTQDVGLDAGVVDAGAADAGNPVTDAGLDAGNTDGGSPVDASLPPPDGANLEVRVQASEGPQGGSPLQIDRRIYGMSIANWRPEDYRPSPAPDFLAYLSALSPGVLRWPAGHSSQEYTWERGGAGQTGEWVLTTSHVDAFMALASEVGAEVLLAINVKTSTPEAAADLVSYVNEEQGYDVAYVQIGNEPDFEDDQTASPAQHVERHTAFVDAILAVDPSVQIVAPELMTGAHALGIHGTTDWLLPLLEEEGARIDAISWHYYALDSGQAIPQSSAQLSIENLFQESAPDWRPAAMSFVEEIMPALDERRDALAPGAEIWVTELGEDPGPEEGVGLADTMAGAIWSADILGRYAGHGADAILRWLFKGGPGQLLSLIDENNVPRPNYGTWWLYARHFGDRLVAAESDDATVVAAHAALRDDGLSLVLANKTDTARLVSVAFEGFTPTSGERFTLEGQGLQSGSFTINGQTVSPEVAVEGISPAALADDEVLGLLVPPASVVLVIYR